MNTLSKLLKGYERFRHEYAEGDNSHMQALANKQQPEIMVVGCSDSRVDPAVILQCDPGDLFMVRNVANIIPPYDNDSHCHGTSAALEFGVCHLQVKHLIILGHSQCAGINAMLNGCEGSDFIEDWVNAAKPTESLPSTVDGCAQTVLHHSYQNCMGFPWIKERVNDSRLKIHRWFFNIADGSITQYDLNSKSFLPLQ